MNLVRRVSSAAVLLAVVAACLWLGGPYLGTLIGAGALLAAWEFAGLSSALKTPPLTWLLYPLTLWWALRFYLPDLNLAAEGGMAAAIVAGLIGILMTRATTVRWAATFGGAAYIGLCIGYFAGLFTLSGHLDHFGLRLVLLALAGPLAGDTAAYFVGSAFGRHRFFESISPKKSVEGAVAAALVTIGVLALVAAPLAGMPAWQGGLLGLGVTVAAQGGDLVESKFKREAGVKDSSNLIPGHGGLLDRLDSLLFVAPMVYWFVKMTGLT